MTDQTHIKPSPYHENSSVVRDMAELTYGFADATSFFWQPLLKGLGRTQIEAASFVMANMHATYAYSRAASRAVTPNDLLRAHTAYLDALSKNFSRGASRVSGALSQASEPVLRYEVIAFPRTSERPESAKVDREFAVPSPDRQVA